MCGLEYAVTAEQPLTAPERPVVLIAEDEARLRSMLQLALRSEGYDVVLCEDGEAAITTLEGLERVDIALLDLRMPRLSGQEVLTWIRRHPRYAALPVVTMSASATICRPRRSVHAAPVRSCQSRSAWCNSSR